MELKNFFFKFSFFCRFSLKVKLNNKSLLCLDTYKLRSYQLLLFFKKKKWIYNCYYSFDSHVILYLKKKNSKYKKKKLIYIKLTAFAKKRCSKYNTDRNLQKNLYILTKLRILFYFFCKRITLHQLKN